MLSRNRILPSRHTIAAVTVLRRLCATAAPVSPQQSEQAISRALVDSKTPVASQQPPLTSKLVDDILVITLDGPGKVCLLSIDEGHPRQYIAPMVSAHIM